MRTPRTPDAVLAEVWSRRGLACDEAAIERLGAVIDAARRAWPDLGIDEEALSRFVAERASRAADLDPARAADLALASECARGSARALAIIEARIRREIAPSVRRLRLGAADVDAALQRVSVDLFVARPDRPPGITRYDGRGDLNGWLRVSAVRAGLKEIRGARHDVAIETAQLGERLAGTDEDPELAYLKAVYRPAFQEAFREALAALRPRDRTLLKQSLLDGLSIDALAALHGVHRATAARWVAAARDDLVSRTRALFQARVALDPDECDSLFRLLKSHLDLTLRRLAADL